MNEMVPDIDNDLDVIFGEYKDKDAVENFVRAVRASNLTGTLYIGYPVLNIDDDKIEFDALLVSRDRGVIIFDLFLAGSDDGDGEESRSLHIERLYAALSNRLNSFAELRDGRRLGVEIVTVAIDPISDKFEEEADNFNVGLDRLSDLPEVSPKSRPNNERIEHLNAAIQRISNLRPKKKREGVQKQDSRGYKIKQIEKNIANLDLWQKRGSIEYVNGPQRIRGLAGSGKTVVLALKAAYLHVKRPDWRIVVTFNTRALYQQFESLITRFVYAQISDEPDWSKLKIMHAWGGSDRDGVYSEYCDATNTVYRDFGAASRMFGYDTAFSGACDEAYNSTADADLDMFDMVLIDEAQDLPSSFFKLIHRMTKSPKRIVWAYDDLQNLTDTQLPTPRELFGTKADGSPRVELVNRVDHPQEDIVLPRCYRNPPWTLLAAHGLGFGVHREPMAQVFTDLSIWKRLGYRSANGAIEFGRHVRIERDPSSVPDFFEKFVNPEDSLKHISFESQSDQYSWVAKEIRRLIDEEEMEHSDILIVLPDVYTSKSEGGKVLRALLSQGVSGHIPGQTSSRDVLFKDDSVAITHIFRAKGNEAPVVFILNADFCDRPFGIKKRRNILFTAITRSRAWTYICGTGDGMTQISSEIDQIRDNQFLLDFIYPSLEEARNLAVTNDNDSENPDLFEDFEEVREVLKKVRGKQLPKDIMDELSALSGGA